jgi:ADP-dependent NAD(P)H-hydrate dehydratase
MSTPSDSGSRSREVTPSLLREWALPAATDSKYSRGRVLIVGGAARTPGAAQLSGLAALRVGAGHLTLAVAGSAAVALAVATPESGVTGLPENAAGSVLGEDLTAIESDLGRADVVVVGPGLDDAEQAKLLLQTLLPLLNPEAWLLLDAYALPALAELDADKRPDRLALTPNTTEASVLLGRDLGDDLAAEVAVIAERYAAIVSCQGVVAGPDGRTWRISAGHGGLATSGSGDVLAGALAGILARGADGDQAACWATHVHAAAGDRLAAGVGPLGFLAHELLDQLPRVMVELTA